MSNLSVKEQVSGILKLFLSKDEDNVKLAFQLLDDSTQPVKDAFVASLIIEYNVDYGEDNYIYPNRKTPAIHNVRAQYCYGEVFVAGYVGNPKRFTTSFCEEHNKKSKFYVWCRFVNDLYNVGQTIN